MRRKYIVRLLCIILCCCLMVCVINPLFKLKQNHYYAVNTDVTELPYFAEKWDGFYEKERATIDVLYVGSSDFHTDIDPNVIYEKNGFTSYVLSADQMSGKSVRYYIEEALKYQSPKVVFVDVQSLIHPDTHSELSHHYSYDYMKLGITKLRGILQMEEVNYEELLFPFIKYHNRWEELSELDFKYFSLDKKNLLNGHFCYMLVSAQNAPTKYKYQDARWTLDNLGYNETARCIDEILKYCNEKKIKMVLVRTPNIYSYKEFEYYCALEKYVSDRDILFWNFNEDSENMRIDYTTDFVDSAHMNQQGSEKFSDYFGKKIKNSFRLPDHRFDFTYEEWNEAYRQEQHLIDVFNIRHYNYADEYYENGKMESEDLCWLYTYKNRDDLIKIPGVSQLIGNNKKNREYSKLCFISSHGGEYELGNNVSCDESIDSKLGCEVQFEYLSDCLRIWIDDTYIQTQESDGIVDLIIYDKKINKIIEHCTINTKHLNGITHLLNPY